MSSSFIWTDLSTFDLKEARRFYSRCFDWTYQNIGEGYLQCQIGKTPCAGLYTMPEKFQNIGMPSFWMSYIRVDNIEKTVQLAEANGARIEIRPQSASGGGLIALIRDPAGAGFTCYQGEDLGGKEKSNAPSRMTWNELHVSDLSKVESFYANVFDWVITPATATPETVTPANDGNSYDIHCPAGDKLAGITVTANEIKGDKEYWGVYFSVTDMQTALENIKTSGGEVGLEEYLRGRQTALVYDTQGAAFYLTH